MQFTLPNIKEKADVPHDLVDKVQPVEDNPGYVQAYLPDEQTIILTEDAVIGTDDERIQSVTPSEDGTTVIVEADVPPNAEEFVELWRLAIEGTPEYQEGDALWMLLYDENAARITERLDEEVYADAIRQAFSGGILTEEAEKYASTIAALAAGEDPFEGSSEQEEWERWCEERGLPSNPPEES